MKILAILILCAALAAGQTDKDAAPFLTYGVFNGRAWGFWSEREKNMYLFAVAEALASEAKGAFLQRYHVEGLSVSETRQAIDRFFAEPENRLIGALSAIRIVSLKAKGSPQPVIDLEIAVQRRVAQSAPERK